MAKKFSLSQKSSEINKKRDSPWLAEGEELRRLRKEKGLKTSYCASKVKKNKATWNNWERGVNPPDASDLRTIEVDILGVGEGYFRRFSTREEQIEPLADLSFPTYEKLREDIRKAREALRKGKEATSEAEKILEQIAPERKQ